jgi:integrase
LRGSIKSRSKGSHTVWIELPKTIDGKRRREVFTVRGKLKDAEAAMARRISEIESGIFSDASRVTVAEYLERWLVATEARIGARTFERYASIVRDTLIPTFGQQRLAKLTPLHVEDAVGRWRTQPRRDRKKGTLSSRTVNHFFSTLKAALTQAVHWNLVPRNPCDAVRAPSKGNAHVKAIDEHQAVALLGAMGGTVLAMPTRVALLSGLRRGELLALRWEDVDFERGVIHVRRSLERLRSGELRFKEPKTAKSRRAVPIPSQALDGLRAHRVEQAKFKLALGGRYQDQGLVFPEHDGRPWDPDRFSSAFYYRVAASGLPKVSFHGLRHSFASIMLRAGAPLKVTSEALGHTTVAITADLYTDVLGGLQREAADQLGATFGAALNAAQAASEAIPSSNGHQKAV